MEECVFGSDRGDVMRGGEVRHGTPAECARANIDRWALPCRTPKGGVSGAAGRTRMRAVNQKLLVYDS